MSARIAPLGDSAITITFGDEISEELNDRVVAEALRISSARLAGVYDVVPAYASLTIHYDPRRIVYADLVSRLSAIGPPSGEKASTGTVTHEIRQIKAMRIPISRNRSATASRIPANTMTL